MVYILFQFTNFLEGNLDHIFRVLSAVGNAVTKLSHCPAKSNTNRPAGERWCDVFGFQGEDMLCLKLLNTLDLLRCVPSMTVALITKLCAKSFASCISMTADPLKMDVGHNHSAFWASSSTFLFCQGNTSLPLFLL